MCDVDPRGTSPPGGAERITARAPGDATSSTPTSRRCDIVTCGRGGHHAPHPPHVARTPPSRERCRMSTVASDPSTTAPLVEGRKSVLEQSLVIAFMIIPVVALIAAVTLAWGWGITLARRRDRGHRLLRHRSRGHGRLPPLLHPRVVQGQAPAADRAGDRRQHGRAGPGHRWVADHRRHHAFSDKEGDPHSPWLFGTAPAALAKGFWHAHMGWLFDGPDQRRSGSPPICSPTGTSPRSTGSSRC